MNIKLPEEVIESIISDWFRANIRGGDDLEAGDYWVIWSLIDDLEAANHQGWLKAPKVGA